MDLLGDAPWEDKRDGKLLGGVDEAQKGVEDDNGDEFSWLEEIEVPHFKWQRVKGKKLNLWDSNRWARGRKVEGLRLVWREGREEEEDRSLSMAPLILPIEWAMKVVKGLYVEEEKEERQKPLG